MSHHMWPLVGLGALNPTPELCEERLCCCTPPAMRTMGLFYVSEFVAFIPRCGSLEPCR